MGEHGTYSVSHELDVLLQNKADIKAAIEAKNPVTAPTEVMSQWPESIASIPNAYRWKKPEAWPDIKEALEAHPAGATASESNAIAILVNCMNVTQIRMRCATSYRFGDDPDSVVTAANAKTYVYHQVPEGTEFMWVIAYAADSIYIVQTENASASIDGSSYSPNYIIWAVCKGVAEFRGWNYAVISIDNGTSTLDRHGAGGGYLQGCSSLKNISFKSMSTTISDARSLFNSCYALRQADLTRWNTSSFTRMASMFYNCTCLESLDLSGWDTSNVYELNAVFSGCSSLRILDIRGWDLSSVTTASDLFYNCRGLESLVGGDLAPSAPDSSKGPRFSVNISYSQNLDRASVLWLIAWLADLNGLGLDSQTLKLAWAAKSRITESDIAVATAKGWTVA